MSPTRYYPEGYRNYSRVIGDRRHAGCGRRRMGAVARLDEGLRPRRRPGLRPGPRPRRGPSHFGKIGGTVVSANGTSESYDAEGDRLRRPRPEDQGRPARTSSSSARSPVRTPASSGRTSASAMPDIAILAGDGVNEKSWYDGAGAAGNGTYLTFGGVGTSQLRRTARRGATSTRPTTTAPSRRSTPRMATPRRRSPSPRCTKAGTNDRCEVLKAIMATSGLDTVIGPMTFDANGDVKGGVITSYQVGTTLAARLQGRHHSSPSSSDRRGPTAIAFGAGPTARPDRDLAHPRTRPSHRGATPTAWTKSSRPSSSACPTA